MTLPIKTDDKIDPREQKKHRLHFIGIGGIGMSGIAELFFKQGYPVQGSDVSDSESVKKLKSMGIQVTLGHFADSVKNADVVVYSSAVNEQNVEMIEARKLQLPLIRRAEMLAELMRDKIGIAVAGTHGKTTTTSLLATVLSHAHYDPTIVNGGKVEHLGGNAKLGKSSLVVAEADESDGSFLLLPYIFSIITNIDTDHLDHYEDLRHIKDCFAQFIEKCPFYGKTILCYDDESIRELLKSRQISKPILTYGITSTEAQLRATEVQLLTLGSTFKVLHHQKLLGQIELRIPGLHNVKNSLAVIAVCLELGLSFDQIQQGLMAYQGVKRRFEVKYQSEELLIIDDYGHHPTEIRATLAAAKSFWNQPKDKIITVFQPHRYSRTFYSYHEFLNCFKDTNELILTDIYSAGEKNTFSVSSEQLAKDLNRGGVHAKYEESFKNIKEYLIKNSQTINKKIPNSSQRTMILCMGAGSITHLSDELVQLVKQKNI